MSPRCRQRIGEALGVECRLHDARRHMRPRDEGRVAEQRHAAERDAGRFKIEDRLQDDLRRGISPAPQAAAREALGVALDRRDQLRAGSAAAGSRRRGCGRSRRCKGRRGRSPSTGRNQTKWQRALAGSAARRRHRDRQHQFAVRKAEHHAVEHQLVEVGRKLMRPRPRRARPHSRRSAARAPGRNCARTVECSPSAATSRSPSARGRRRRWR